MQALHCALLLKGDFHVALYSDFSALCTRMYCLLVRNLNVILTTSVAESVGLYVSSLNGGKCFMYSLYFIVQYADG